MTVAKTKKIANIRANRLNLAMTIDDVVCGWNNNFFTLPIFFGLGDANDCCIVKLALLSLYLYPTDIDESN